MTDTDELDDTWRDALRSLLPDGDAVGAPARVDAHLRARARRRRTVWSAAAAVASAAIVATGLVATRHDNHAPSVGPSSTTLQRISMGGGPRVLQGTVHVTVRSDHGGHVMVFTTGHRAADDFVTVLPGRVDVYWDGVPCLPDLDCVSAQVRLGSLVLRDGRTLAPGHHVRLMLGAPDRYGLLVEGVVVNRAGDFTNGVIRVMEPNENPPTHATEYLAFARDPTAFAVFSHQARLPSPAVIAPGVYSASFKDAAGGTWTLSAGAWSRHYATGSAVDLDLPLGHYSVLCPDGRTLALTVGG